MGNIKREQLKNLHPAENNGAEAKAFIDTLLANQVVVILQSTARTHNHINKLSWN